MIKDRITVTIKEVCSADMGGGENITSRSSMTLAAALLCALTAHADFISDMDGMDGIYSFLAEVVVDLWQWEDHEGKPKQTAFIQAARALLRAEKGITELNRPCSDET